MTRYELLTKKADLCLQAALRTTGLMSDIWFRKSQELRLEASNLPLIKASEIGGK